MKNKNGIFTFIGLIVAVNIIGGLLESDSFMGLPSFISYFVIFGIIINFVNRANNKGKKTSNKTSNNDSSQWSNIEPEETNEYTTHECEYCGHINHSFNEYCENCGAKQLPQ